MLRSARMKPKDSKPLHIKLESKLWERIDKYRYKRMFPTRTAAIEHLLDFALKSDPPKAEPKQQEG